MVETAVELTVGSLLAQADEVLKRAGCGSPRLDAELLLAAALGVTRTELFLAPATPVNGPEGARFDRLVARRAAREPVAYILGLKAFRHVSLAVDRRVLIPRPETELLVEVGLGLDPGARVLDVGTGSGAVALALKNERPDLELWASELSPDALDVARGNASRLGLDVHFLLGDLIIGGPYDAVLANLPYIAEREVLEPEIASYEPPAALFAGADGLGVLRRLAGMLGEVPLVGLEVGAGQAYEVEALLRSTGLRSVERLLDLAGHERVLVARR